MLFRSAEVEEEKQTKVGMIVGYTLGGTLVAAGTGMIIYYFLKNKKGERKYAVSANSSNLVISF